MTSEARRRIMRAVKSKNTQPELAVRRILRAAGFHYRLYGHSLPGRPDVFFATRKKAIFIHGCFWHGHSCARGARIPKTNVAYWRAKIARNQARDKTVRKALNRIGWSTMAIWECQLKNEEKLYARLRRFLE